MPSVKLIKRAIRTPYRTTGVNPYNSHGAQAEAWRRAFAGEARREELKSERAANRALFDASLLEVMGMQ